MEDPLDGVSCSYLIGGQNIGYRHYFYGVDLAMVQDLFGSDDMGFAATFAELHGRDLEQLDLSLPETIPAEVAFRTSWRENVARVRTFTATCWN